LAVALVGALLYVGFHPGSGFAHGKGRFIGCLMEKFADELALSTQQKEQLMQIAEEVRDKHQEMRTLHAAAKKEVIGELRNQEIDIEMDLAGKKESDIGKKRKNSGQTTLHHSHLWG
jgi:hypothetical protein